MRTVICHYHIYKNSGTSFDTLLTENYGDRHICFDGPFPFFKIDQEQLAQIIDRKEKVVAFSSHQIHLPVPVSLDFNVLPVIFVRHPLLRILSIYKFKKNENDGTVISNAAQEMDFDEWIGFCFSDRQEIMHISNSQTRFLGNAYCQKPLMRRSRSVIEFDIQQAIRNIESVPLLARTEFFGEDVQRFPKILRSYGVEFKFSDIEPQNSTSTNHHKSIEERLDNVKQLLSDKNYQKLLDANEQDLILFDRVAEIINSDISNP